MCKMKTYDYVNLMTIKETHEPNVKIYYNWFQIGSIVYVVIVSVINSFIISWLI